MRLNPMRIKLMACACMLFVLAGYSTANTVGKEAFTQGCDAFKKGDWYSAMLLLRKAVAFPANDTAETWYMLIASEMYAASYAEAALDCDYYLQSFPDSMYVSYVQYQKGRASFYLGDYEKSVLLLSDFCHEYRDDELYASALFWIAESFFAGYNYDEARALYARIVDEFPDDAKASAAQFRLETIAQRTREEKLLHLLKKTGEAYLSAKENYEKQLKMYDTINTSNSLQRASDLQKQNSELLSEISALRAQIAELELRTAATPEPVEEQPLVNERILRLKEKAHHAQELLDGGVR